MPQQREGVSSNPYAGRPDYSFWRRAVTRAPAEDVDPVTHVPFTIAKSDAVATAGSCFAQHIARTLTSGGFNYFVTEPAPLTPWAAAENYGVYPARFGNLYTVAQLSQLFDRAHGLFEPRERFWQRSDGALVDPFRPQIQKAGFASPEALEADREAHFTAVRRMFADCRVFIFTLGLTEGWISRADGAAFPLAPGVAGGVYDPALYEFRNFGVSEMAADLSTFVRKLRAANPWVRIILTVSPVPLVATFEDRHVLVSTVYSKSALRVVAQMVSDSFADVAYFPSYEIITGPQARGRYFAEDAREITEYGVARVMSVFRRHFLSELPAEDREAPSRSAARVTSGASDANGTRDENATLSRYALDLQAVICDEEALDP